MAEAVSRRRLFIWLAAAVVGVTVPALVSEPAEAQTVGMERRETRRAGRRIGRRVRRRGRRAARAIRRRTRWGM
jgi:hypothetical protein